MVSGLTKPSLHIKANIVITSDLILILGALGTLLLSLGGGVKWLMAHVDAKTSAAQLVESEARALMSRQLHDDIRQLRLELAIVRTEKAIFLRRIYQLERFIHTQPGVDIPEMVGWPPSD